jgi:hypothetical protein
MAVAYQSTGVHKRQILDGLDVAATEVSSSMVALFHILECMGVLELHSVHLCSRWLVGRRRRSSNAEKP